MPTITLLTDFGTRDWFTGVMKGVILGVSPRAAIVDITHEIPAGDLRAGAFALAASARFFPKGTVHVAIVDPGVGGPRQAIAVQTENYCFVGPDNGLLSWVLAKEKVLGIVAIENPRYLLAPVSRTFHGRDIFAPVAAHLSRGLPLKKLGRPLKSFVELDWPEPRLVGSQLHGEVVYIDHFGNALTNLHEAAVRLLVSESCAVFTGRRRLCPLAEFYQAVPAGKPVAILGSSGFLEIALNRGNAAQRLRLRPGQTITVQSPRAVRRNAGSASRRRRSSRAGSLPVNAP
jgi:S-adenosylmethionine hydrolase